MSTPRDLIRAALKDLGAIGQGETPSASELSDGFDIMKRMLDSWANDKLMVFAQIIEEFTLTGNQSEYTMGADPTADFNTIRPQEIVGAGIKTNGAEYPLSLIQIKEFQGIQVKDSTSNIPRKLYWNPTFPLMTLTLWPVPSDTTKIEIYSWKPLSQLTNVSSSFILPLGYEEAIEYNLAIRLAPQYGKSASPEIASLATSAKAAIRRTNTKPSLLVADAALLTRGRPYNIYTGE